VLHQAERYSPSCPCWQRHLRPGREPARKRLVPSTRKRPPGLGRYQLLLKVINRLRYLEMQYLQYSTRWWKLRPTPTWLQVPPAGMIPPVPTNLNPPPDVPHRPSWANRVTVELKKTRKAADVNRPPLDLFVPQDDPKINEFVYQYDAPSVRKDRPRYFNDTKRIRARRSWSAPVPYCSPHKALFFNESFKE